MPRKVNVNWEQVKLMRYEGLTFREISEKLKVNENTLSVRASREGWANQIKQAKQEIERAMITGASLTFQEKAQRFNAALADDVDATLHHVTQKVKPGDWEELVKRETVMEKLTKRGRATYGLDQAGPSTVVNVAIMGEVLSNPATDVQVVDVQEVKTEENA